MEHKFSLGSFHRKNGTTLPEIPFIPENSSGTNQTVLFPFTSQPEFPEFFGKWKTPLSKRVFVQSLSHENELNLYENEPVEGTRLQINGFGVDSF